MAGRQAPRRALRQSETVNAVKHFAPRPALLFRACALFAQTPSASAVGRVTDASGAVVPGVAIAITNLDTSITQKGSTNAVGDFTIPYLNPGRYALEASTTGFQTHKRSEFTLAVDQVLRLDIRLQIGTASET